MANRLYLVLLDPDVPRDLVVPKRFVADVDTAARSAQLLSERFRRKVLVFFGPEVSIAFRHYRQEAREWLEEVADAPKVAESGGVRVSSEA